MQTFEQENKYEIFWLLIVSGTIFYIGYALTIGELFIPFKWTYDVITNPNITSFHDVWLDAMKDAQRILSGK